jgi:hypothetical protein
MKMRVFPAIPSICFALLFCAQLSIAQTKSPKYLSAEGATILPSESVYLEENEVSGSDIGFRLLMILTGEHPEEVQSETTSRTFMIRTSRPARYKLEILSLIGTNGRRFDKLGTLSLVVDDDSWDFGQGSYSIENKSDLAQESVKWNVTKEQLIKLQDAKTVTVKLCTGNYVLDDDKRLAFQEWISRMIIPVNEKPD